MSFEIHQLNRYNAREGGWSILQTRLPRSFRQKLGNRPLPLLVHPLFSQGELFGPDGLTARGKRFEPPLTEKAYQIFLDGLINYLKTLPVFIVLAEAGEGAKQTRAWLESLRLEAKVILVETGKREPLPLVPVPFKEIVDEVKHVIGDRWAKLRNGIAECHLDRKKNFQPTYVGMLHIDKSECYLTDDERTGITRIFESACYRKFAWLLKKNGIKAIELMGELLHMKHKDGKTFPFGCADFMANHLMTFFQVNYQPKLVFPGYEYTEVISPGLMD